MMQIECLFQKLKRNSLRVSIAESFTGGGVASAFVQIPGASDVLSVGLVCYTNEAKERFLGVDKGTISKYGAVSAETIEEMLNGLERLGMSDINVATSGNAGPTAEKPKEVGVFYLGVSYNGKRIIRRYKADGYRRCVIEKGIDECINLMDEIIQ